MLRRCLILLGAAVLPAAAAGLWPDHVGTARLKSSATYQPAASPSVWGEFGLTQSSKADYGSFQAVVYQFKDATGAYAAAKWLYGTSPSAVAAGNFALTCTGNCPRGPALPNAFLAHAGRASHPNPPPVVGYLPQAGRVAASERYVLGPASLSEFAPAIPTPAAAFQFGTEAALARYKAANGEAQLAIFRFLTPQMARQQAPEFEKIAAAKVKRTGPLVAVVLSASTDALATRLLGQVNYEASVAWSEPIPKPFHARDLGDMLYSIALLGCLLVAFCVLAGVAFGLIRIAARRLGLYPEENESMITLHLRD